MSRAAAVGARVFLRHPTGGDKSEWVRLRDESETHLERWEPTLPGQAGMLPSEIAFDKFLASSDLPEAQRFVVCLAESGAIAGQLSFNQIFRGPFQNAITGYWVGAAHSRRGLMTEALTLGLAHVFGRLGLHRVEANIMPENDASKALVQRLGFRFEGLALRYLRIDGDWRDHEHWAITAEEWAERGRDGRRKGMGQGGRVGDRVKRARR